MSTDDVASGGLVVPSDAGPIEVRFTDAERERIEPAAEAEAFDTVEAFVREATLRLVDETIDEDGRLPCPHDDCDRTFATIAQRRGHLGNQHADVFPDGDFWCGYCGYGPSAFRGINAHHAQLHQDRGDPVRLDHEPAPDDLLAPEDVPDHQDPDLLAQLYAQCDGNITEMCRSHEFDVGVGRVRHYLIEFGIHEPTPNGEGDDAPRYRDREWMKARYEAADGNISEMHRRLEADEDAPNFAYRTLVKNLKRFDFHDPTDPPGKHHGKGGPSSSDADGSDDGDETAEDDEQDSRDDDRDVPAADEGSTARTDDPEGDDTAADREDDRDRPAPDSLIVVDDPDAADSFDDLATPEWLTEASWELALGMAPDAETFADKLGWGDPAALAAMVDLLGRREDLPEEPRWSA